MIKVSFTDKETNIYNEKVVIVTLKGRLVTSPNIFSCLCNFSEILNWMENHKGIAYGYMGDNIVVTGRASCSPEDKFDPEKGMRIAEARAKIKLYNFLWTLSIKLRRALLKVLGGKKIEIWGYDNIDSYSIMGCCAKYEVLYSQERVHLDKILRDEPDTKSTD